MQVKYSIKRKIMIIVSACFLCMILLVLVYSIIGVRAIVTQEKEDAYALQLDIITSTLQKKHDKLESSGMTELYEDRYKKSVLEEMQANYYHEKNHGFPLIVDADNAIVLHPYLEVGDLTLQQSESFLQLLQGEQNRGVFTVNGEAYWAIFKAFEPWQWTVVYTLPTQKKNQAVNHFAKTMITILLPVAVLFIGLMAIVIRRVVTPLVSMTTVVQEITAGDLTRTVTAEGQDEIHLLANQFNQMVSNLKQVLANAQMMVRQITISGQEINTISERQVQGAAQHACAVSETAAATTELSKASEHIGEHVQMIMDLSNRVLNGMDKIKTSTDQTNQILVSLNEKSKQIGAITGLIGDVADQTNLLAVNAAIEAARAGEQGRGFTVVADQIGKLADSTAKSTKDIASLVELIQHEMTNATLAMDQSLEGVDEEIELTKASAEKSKEIAMSVNEQIVGTQQIAQSMKGIESTMNDIVSGVQRSAEAAAELSQLADGLQGSMTLFKTNEASVDRSHDLSNHTS